MRFAYSLKQKVKIATLLFFVMTCSILITILEEKSVNKMNESFSSLYNDRLIPAMDLFQVVEIVYSKKSLLEELIYRNNPTDLNASEVTLKRSNFTIDSLIGKYEKTFLVQKEKELLLILKNQLTDLEETEQTILQLLTTDNKSKAHNLFEGSGQVTSDRIVKNVSNLMRTQKQVGTEIITDTAFVVSGSRIYSNLQIALAVVIGILIVGILFTSNVVYMKNDKFNLN
jgi:hypothetical protein